MKKMQKKAQVRQNEKRILSALLAGFMLFCMPIVVKAAGHVHGNECYSVTEGHTHSGNSTSGGGCYGNAVYHSHSGNSTSGGGCYGAVVYHTHTGNSWSGGGCYGAPYYHYHSGDAVNGGGCYTSPIYHSHSGDAVSGGGCYVYSSVEAVCNPTISEPSWATAHGCVQYCSYCNASQKAKQYGWGITHQCGSTYGNGLNGYTKCDVCGNVSYVWGSGTSRPSVGSHTYTKSGYVLNCGLSDTSIVGYTHGCGIGEGTIQGYNLSCGKGNGNVDYYNLTCGKNESTVEYYTLSCGKTEKAATKTLICTIPEGYEEPAKTTGGELTTSPTGGTSGGTTTSTTGSISGSSTDEGTKGILGGLSSAFGVSNIGNDNSTAGIKTEEGDAMSTGFIMLVSGVGITLIFSLLLVIILSTSGKRRKNLIKKIQQEI